MAVFLERHWNLIINKSVIIGFYVIIHTINIICEFNVILTNYLFTANLFCLNEIIWFFSLIENTKLFDISFWVFDCVKLFITEQIKIANIFIGAFHFCMNITYIFFIINLYVIKLSYLINMNGSVISWIYIQSLYLFGSWDYYGFLRNINSAIIR